MELLRHCEDRGYPVEYLLSRIRGRRSRLIADWRPLVYDAAPMDYLASARYHGFVKDRSPEGISRCLLKEYRWVYSQMNHGLREIFRPFFLYTELRTIFICLRHLKDEKSGKAEDLLGDSLLSAGIVKILSSSEDLPSAVRGIERAFSRLSEQFGWLSNAFEAEGLRGVELSLTNTYLAVISRTGLHPLVKTFFARLIDSRNIMSVYKCLRQEKRAAFPFITGGMIPEAKLRAIVDKRDLFSVNALIRKFSGIKIEMLNPTNVEVAFYKGMTRFLKKEGKEPFGAGPILDYLWKCSIEVMNLSVLFYGKDLERETVMTELVQ
jgi:vacuolar-type H+-ATPase subunit C/Vma6